MCCHEGPKTLISERTPRQAKNVEKKQGGKKREGEDKEKEPRTSQVSVKSKEQARVKQEKDNIYVMSWFI